MKMGRGTSDNGEETKDMEKVCTFGKMEPNMMACGRMARPMAREYSGIFVVTDMREH